MLPKSFTDLIRHFSSLPSIGPKMAERIVLHLFKQSTQDTTAFANALKKLENLTTCKECHNVSDTDICAICRDPQRDSSIFCIVEDALDAIAIERSGMYQGLYHVLGGVLQTGKQGDNADSLTFSQLKTRIEKKRPKEILIATNPTAEGDLTALYLKQQLANYTSIRISRIARGLATGGDIEYADDQTIASAIKNRQYYST